MTWYYRAEDPDDGRRIPGGIVRWYNGTLYAQRWFAHPRGHEIAVGIHNGFPPGWNGQHNGEKTYRGYRAEEYNVLHDDIRADRAADRRMMARLRAGTMEAGHVRTA